MPVTKTTTYVMTLFDDAVIAHPSGAMTVTLPPVADCAGRAFKVARLWQEGNTDYAVTVNNSTGIAEHTFAATVGTRNTSVSFTSNGMVWTKQTAPATVTGSPSFTGAADAQYLFDTASGNGTLTLPATTADMVSAKRRVYISNVNGAGTVTVNRTSPDTIDYANDSWVAQNAQTSMTLTAGQTRVLYASATGKWRDSRLDIEVITQSGALNLGSGYTKSVFRITPNGSGITLPSASAHYNVSGKSAALTISNPSATAMTITRAGSDVFYDTTSGVTTQVGTTKSIPAYSTVSFTAISASVWRTSDYDANANVLTWNGASPDVMSAAWSNVKYTGGAATEALPATSTAPNFTLQIVNSGSGTLTITPPSGKKLFTSTGYVASTTIATNRSATFVYSAGLDAWVKA